MPEGFLERLLAQIPDESLPPDRRGRRRLALTGLSKNAGKTTVLNFLLQAAATGVRAPAVGLITTGRDGEAVDAVTELPKPSILAPAGTLVVTARDALRAGRGPGGEVPGAAEPVGAVPGATKPGAAVRTSQINDFGHVSENLNVSCTPSATGNLGVGAAGNGAAGAPETAAATLDELAEFPWETPWGPIILARVRQAGHVVLIGPGSTSRLQQCLQRLEAAGATLTLIDGSLDRLAAAAPGVADGVVLSCGAAAGETLERVVALATSRATLLQLPVFSHEQAGPLARGFIAAVHEAIAKGESVPTLAAIEVEGEKDAPTFRLRPLGVTTALGQASAVVRALKQARILVVAGALPGSLLARLNLEPALTKHLHIIVADGTRVQPDMMAWRKFHRLGGRVWAAAPIRLLGLTSNPWRPGGQPEDAEELLEALHAAVPGVPICDLHLGRCLP